MKITARLSKGRDYQGLFIDNVYIVNTWGKVTSVELQKNGKYFIGIDGTDTFIHDVDEIIYVTKETPLAEAITECLSRK